MLLSDVVEPVIGLTPDRWDVVLMGFGIVAFTCGVLIAERF